MSHTLTLEDIWKLFQETNRLFQESKLESKLEWERRSLKTERDLEETRRIIRENSAEADRAIKETRLAIQETRLAIRETDLEVKETSRVVRETSRQIGQLGSRWGDFVEGMVAPACETLFAQRGIPVHNVSRQVKARLPGNRHMEVDLLVVNTDVAVLVEVKSKLKHDDVREHLTRVAEFKDFFPIYARMRIMGAVAGIVIDENVDRFAMNEGLFVMVQSGEGVQLANDETFVPRAW